MRFDGRKLYVSGPMTGYADFNFPLFDDVAADARERGAERVFSPAQHDRDTIIEVWGKTARPENFPGYAEGDIAGYFDAITSGGKFTLETMFQWDLDVITNHADALLLLPGWQASTGARFERIAAEALSKPLILVLNGDAPGTFDYIEDPNQKRMTEFLRGFNA